MIKRLEMGNYKTKNGDYVKNKRKYNTCKNNKKKDTRFLASLLKKNKLLKDEK